MSNQTLKNGFFYIVIQRGNEELTIEAGVLELSVFAKLQELDKIGGKIKRIFIHRQGKKVDYMLVNEMNEKVKLLPVNEETQFKMNKIFNEKGK